MKARPRIGLRESIWPAMAYAPAMHRTTVRLSKAVSCKASPSEQNPRLCRTLLGQLQTSRWMRLHAMFSTRRSCFGLLLLWFSASNDSLPSVNGPPGLHSNVLMAVATSSERLAMFRTGRPHNDPPCLSADGLRW